MRILDNRNLISFKDYAISDVGLPGVHYLAGFYTAPAAAATLTIGGTVTQTLGIGNIKCAHAFCVASAAGGTDLVLTVSGASITDAGVLTLTDTEIIVADTDTATTNQYFETNKKWVGQVTYTLTGAAGAFTFNYGFAKYEDYGNRNYTVTDFEMTLHGNASETGFNIELLKHTTTGWTYSAAAFIPGNGAICSSLTDLTSTYDNYINNSNVAYKRANLNTLIAGGGNEGIVVRITTANNNSIAYGTVHVGVKF